MNAAQTAIGAGPVCDRILPARDLAGDLSHGLSQLASILDCIAEATNCFVVEAIAGAARFARLLGDRADEIDVVLGRRTL